MVTVRVVVDNDGCLTGCDSDGHAGFSGRGDDIVCSAITVLVRTAAETLGGKPGSGLEWEAPERGVLRFRVVPGGRESGNRDWERGVADYLIGGLLRLGHEYPDFVNVNIQRK